MARNVLKFPLFNPKRKKLHFFSDQTLLYTFKEASGKIEMQRGASATKNVAIIDDFSKKKVQTSIRHNMADEQNEESLVPLRCVVKV